MNILEVAQSFDPQARVGEASIAQTEAKFITWFDVLAVEVAIVKVCDVQVRKIIGYLEEWKGIQDFSV